MNISIKFMMRPVSHCKDGC